MLDATLLRAYHEAHYFYRYRGQWHRLRAADHLTALALPAQTQSAAFITAMNPASQLLEENDNRARHRALLNALARRGARWLPAYATDAERNWPLEYGCLWLNPSEHALNQMLSKFGQLAALATVDGNFVLHYPDLPAAAQE